MKIKISSNRYYRVEVEDIGLINFKPNIPILIGIDVAKELLSKTNFLYITPKKRATRKEADFSNTQTVVEPKNDIDETPVQPEVVSVSDNKLEGKSKKHKHHK